MSYPSKFGNPLRRHVVERLERFEVATIDQSWMKHAAVAVTLLPDERRRPCYLLTRRAATLKRHRGQWALPGGRLDQGESPIEAALRELAEEVRLELGPEAVLGRLDDYATRSGYIITPVVVWCDNPRTLDPDPAEVAYVRRVPLADLDRPEVPILKTIEQSERPVLAMPVGDRHIHAPTAAFLYQLLEVALRGNEVRVADYEQPVFAWR